jgi:hypothetical protein
MSRIIASIGCAALLLMGGAHLASAKAKAPAATTHSMSGEIVKVDAAAHTFVVKMAKKGGGTRERSFSLAEAAKVTKGGATMALGDVHPGDEVRVTYTKAGMKRHASQVDVTKAAPAAAPAASAPTTTQ